MSLPAELQTPEALRTIANYLRSTNGVRVKSGIEHEKRVDYFKGVRLVECIVEGKKWPKTLPRVEDPAVAAAVANALIQANFFHRSEMVKEKKGYLKISQANVFDDKGYYTWMYAGNMMWSNIATGFIIAIVIGFTLLPIWPDAAKKVLWYCSVTFLLATFAFCTVRMLAFVIMWLLGYDFWIFPRLFDESLSFQDSFKPVYSFDKGSSGQGLYRLGLVVALAAFVYWATTQPTEFDGFLQAQKTFVDDLYSGKLLADVAFDPKDHMERSGKKVPSLEDLLKELEKDEKSISDTAANESMGEEVEEAVNLEGDAEPAAAAEEEHEDAEDNDHVEEEE